MKLFLDSCVWGGAVAELQALGHEVIWSGAWPSDPGDEEILQQARAEGRILVTLDRDFGELAIVHGLPHCGIIRLVGIAARQQSMMCQLALETNGESLQRGAIVTVERGRIRIRPADGDE